MRLTLRFLLVNLVLLIAATAAYANSDVGIAISAPKFAPIGSSTTITVVLTGTTPAPGDNGVVTCHATSLAPSSPLQQPVSLNVPSNTTPGHVFTHQAGVTSGSVDPNSAN